MTAVGLTVTAARPAAAVSAAAAAPGSYTAVQPCRLTDTRTGAGVIRIDPTTIEIAARQACGVPADATSVVVSIAIDAPAAAGFLSAWPADQARPTISNLNFSAGQIRANSAIVPLSTTGRFRVYSNVITNVVVDVVGAFVPAQ
ncbi:MAG TPA: hypothetical protein PLV68_07595, partial [Ilumatobacteraceae bacterium]|nr:hypothetical protein [Ilumatobacteraceae bacterium]